MINFVIEDYREYLELHRSEFPDGLYQSLKSHSRLPKMFENMARELEIIDKRIKRVDRMMIKNVVYDMTAFFIKMVQRHADEAAMSDLEKSRLVAETKKIITDEEASEFTAALVKDKVIMGAEVERLASEKRLEERRLQSAYMKAKSRK